MVLFLNIGALGGRTCKFIDDKGTSIQRSFIKNYSFPGSILSRSIGDTIGQSYGMSSKMDFCTYEKKAHDRIIIIANNYLMSLFNKIDLVRIILQYTNFPVNL